MIIKFCGAAREVTGSAHLIRLDSGYTILLDCGLYQGRNDDMENFNREWLFDPKEIDCLILSHAHIDHTGRVPKLVRDGFTGDIISTHATRSLCSIMLLDSARIQEREADYYNRRNKDKPSRKPLYDARDAERTMTMFTGVAYEKWFTISDSVKVFFRDAGHILGSASVTLEITEGDTTHRIGFTGDIGRPSRPILRDPLPMPEVDHLICESTYGHKEHETAPQEIDRFLEIINRICVEREGKLLIPAFSVGRTQEIVYMLDQLASSGRLPRRLPVFVDSPLAVNATTIFGAHPECYDSELNEYLLTDDDPFGFNSLRYIRKVEASKRLNELQEGCIIISSSGMMTAGRIKHHAFNNIADDRTGILIVGYASPNTLAGRLRDGADEVSIFGKRLPVRAEVFVMDSFSAHADRTEIRDFVANQRERLQQLYLVHGTLDRQEALRDYLGEHGLAGRISIPELGEEVRL